MFALPAEGPREIAPGAVHLPGWLTAECQRRLAAACYSWASGPVPARAARMPNGQPMSVRTVCLGWHWRPYRYSRTADDVGGGRVAPLPEWLAGLGRAALADALGQPGERTSYEPDTALINFYDDSARMGMHQDRDERSSDPVVSFSIGDSCRFRFGNTRSRNRPWTDLELTSGDAFVFHGPSRFAYHGVPRIHPGTAPEGAGVESGRINITLRRTGFD